MIFRFLSARRAVCLLAMGCMVAFAGYSQQRVLRADTLGEATIVAQGVQRETRSHIPLQQFDSLALLRRGISDMTGALRRMAGINLRDYGGAGGLKTVSVRGMGAAHTTVCYDGIALSDARQGQTDVSRFSLDRLSGIALSVADAPDLLCPVRSLGAATLHLTTARPDTSHTWRGTATLRQGAFGMVSPSLSLSRKCGERSAIGLAGDFYYAHNNYPFAYRNGAQRIEERRSNSRMQAGTIEADWTHTSTALGDWRAKAYYRNQHQRLPGQVLLYSQKGTERLAEQRSFAQMNWEKRTSTRSYMAAAKWGWQESRYADVDAQYPNGRLQQNYWQREGYLTAGMQQTLGQLHLAYAADYLFHSLNSNLQKQNNAHRHTLLQALSARYVLGPLQMTARCVAHTDWNHCQNGDATPNVRRLLPSFALSWQILRGKGYRPYLYARTYYKKMLRVPTFSESYFYHLGSQKIRPEQTHQLGMGLTLQASPTPWMPLLKLSADGYANRITHRIVSIPYNLFVWQTVNLGKVRAGGIDLTHEMQLRFRSKHQLFFSANYSFSCATDRTHRAERSYAKQTAYLPRHSGGASLAYENPWLNAVVTMTASGERWSTNEHAPGTHLPAYSEWGCGVYRAFTMRSVHLQLRADVMNLFNHQYEVVKRYPMPGRSYRISLSLHF